jgi:hypothetical protein
MSGSMETRYVLPFLAIVVGVSGCSSAEAKGDASSNSAKPAAAAAAAPKASRIQALLGVTASEAPPPSTSVFSKASMNGPTGWPSQGGDDLWSAIDTSTAKAQAAHCYMTDRLQPGGDPMSGIKLWASSAGGKPASWKGPEPIEIGPDKVPADLWIGEGGVGLGGPGTKVAGVTIAIRPKAKPTVLVVGVTRADAPEATKKKLAGCLESFKLKK